MRSDRQAEPVVILPALTYERLCEADALTDELFLTASPGPHAVLEVGGVAFSKSFDPSRADEPGHVAYCLGEALKMMLRVGAQEARAK